jgi:hypothetical protein
MEIFYELSDSILCVNLCANDIEMFYFMLLCALKAYFFNVYSHT